jgi:hypothetical protein
MCFLGRGEAVVKERQAQHERGTVNEIHLYRNKTAVWLSVAKRCKSTKPHMSMEQHKHLYIHCCDCSYWLLTRANTAL